MTDPVLTTNGEDHNDIDESLIVTNGDINIRLTHPNLYWMVMTLASSNLLLAANFFILKPTFEVYHLSNWVWGTVFLLLGLTKFVFLNAFRNLRAVRMAMSFAISFLLFFAIGTGEPWWDGEGSLQLPILYLGLAAIQLPMLLEPFINPWTATRAQQVDWRDRS